MIGNKMTLQYKVNKQILERLDDNVVVEKSLNFLYVKFMFSDEWRGLTKYAIFNYVDVDSPYKLEVNKDDIVKVPYDLITFPGFLITVQGIKDGEIRITAETDMVDVELLRDIKGNDEAAIRYVTSLNDTINIDKANDRLDLGIATEFEYTPETCTLDLYALTYNTYDDEGQPIEVKTLLSSIVMNSAVVNVEPELNGEGTNRNLIFTFQDGKVIKISIDNFFDEIRQSLAQAVIDLNTKINNEVETLNHTITENVLRLEGLINHEVERATNKENALDTKIDDEIVNRREAITNVINDYTLKIDQERDLRESSDRNLALDYNQKISQETSLREQADNDLQDKITKAGQLVGYVWDNTNKVFILTYDGYIKTTKDLADNNKTRLDNLDTGIQVQNGNVTMPNNVHIKGNLKVEGTTETESTETIQSKSTLIVTNSNNAELSDYTGVVALKGTFQPYPVDAENYQPGYFYYNQGGHYILDNSNSFTSGRTYYVARAEATSVYDVNEDALLLGEGIYFGGNFIFDETYVQVQLDEHSYQPYRYYIKQGNYYIIATGDYDPNQTYYTRVSQGQHIATRADSNYITNGNLIQWDGNAYMLIDSGKSVNDIENEIDDLDTKKVDKEAGKGLSTNDFTNSYKEQVDENTSARHTHPNKIVLDNTTASYTIQEETKLRDISDGATKTEHSNVNGNILIDGQEVNVYTLPNTVEHNTNKVTSVSSSSTDIQYPSAKLLYDTMVDYTSYAITEQMVIDIFDNIENSVLPALLPTRLLSGEE